MILISHNRIQIHTQEKPAQSQAKREGKNFWTNRITSSTGLWLDACFYTWQATPYKSSRVDTPCSLPQHRSTHTCELQSARLYQARHGRNSSRHRTYSVKMKLTGKFRIQNLGRTHSFLGQSGSTGVECLPEKI